MNKTGATRYKKFKKAEKAKTKLKGKKDKELPKGTNVTKTNFKIKKIILKEQLKKHGQNEALSTRKLNIKELLSRLNHFNTNSRIDALDGLKELITSHPDVLENNLGELINGITLLILNIEKKVRQAALKVLHLVLSNVPLEKIEPFFNIMSTYLRSAMTHIDNRIQEDSLFFLDILMVCAPLRVAKDFHKIIPNFLDMISKQRVDAKPGRTLTVNLNSQITSVKWRVKVFQRLQDFFHKYSLYLNIDKIEKPDDSNVTTLKYFNEQKSENYFPLFNPMYISNCNISNIDSEFPELELDEVEKINEYTGTLMPLIYASWLEACPNKKTEGNFETVINIDTALLLKYIIQVITSITSLIKYLKQKYPDSNIDNKFFQKYKLQFSQRFVQTFPFVTNVRSKQAIKVYSEEEEINDPKLTAENLEICNLFILFNPNVHITNQSDEIDTVFHYIEKIFNQKDDCKINLLVIRVLNSLFSQEITGWNRTLAILENLFKKIIWIYFNNSVTETFKREIFALLCTIALNEKLSHFHSCDEFDSWLKNLPDILLGKQINMQTINILHKFAVTNNEVFNTVIKSKLVSIVKNLPKIEIIDSSNDLGYHKLLSIFYYIKVWDRDSLNLLESQLIDNVYKPDHGKYIFDTLRLKSGGIL